MIKGMMIKDFFGFFFIGQGADEAAVTWEPKRPKPSFASQKSWQPGQDQQLSSDGGGDDDDGDDDHGDDDDDQTSGNHLRKSTVLASSHCENTLHAVLIKDE